MPEPSNPPVKCLLCNQDIPEFPAGTVVFKSMGTVGSAALDPYPRCDLQIHAYVHDKCVLQHRDRLVGVQLQATVREIIVPIESILATDVESPVKSFG